MYKKVFSFLFLFSIVFAEEGACPKNSKVDFGPQATYLSLDIQKGTPSLATADQNIKLKGGLGGAFFRYEYKKLHSFYAALITSFYGGKLKHTGVPSRTIYDIDNKARIGYNYFALQGQDLIVSPYFGVGFWYVRQSNTSNTYQYLHTYLPLGFIVDYAVLKRLHIGFLFEWMPDLDSVLKLNVFEGEKWILRRETDQMMVELPIEFLLGDEKQWSLTFTPFWQRRKDGHTLETSTVGLPKQTYTYWGAKLFSSYHF